MKYLSQGNNVAEEGPLAIVGSALDNSQQNVEIWYWIQMWMSTESPKSAENTPKIAKKQEPLYWKPKVY